MVEGFEEGTSISSTSFVVVFADGSCESAESVESDTRLPLHLLW